MKALFFIALLLLTNFTFAQTSTTREVEPGQTTSFDNYELVLIALLGLAILIGLRFWFRRNKK